MSPREHAAQHSGVAPSAVRDVCVCACHVRRGPDLLLLLRGGTGYMDGCWGPPSGKVEAGESYLEAGVRELAEETGLVGQASHLRFLHFLDRLPSDGSHWSGVFFEVDDLVGEPQNTEPAKHREIAWHDIGRLPTPLVDYVRHVVEKTAQGAQFSEWRE